MPGPCLSRRVFLVLPHPQENTSEIKDDVVQLISIAVRRGSWAHNEISFAHDNSEQCVPTHPTLPMQKTGTGALTRVGYPWASQAKEAGPGLVAACNAGHP